MQKDITDRVTDLAGHRQLDDISRFVDSIRIQILGNDIYCREDLKELPDFLVSSFLLIIIQKGEVEITHGSSHYRCRPGNLFIFVPFQSYSACSIGKEPVSFLYLNFEITPYAQRNSFEELLARRDDSCLKTKPMLDLSSTLLSLFQSEPDERPGRIVLLRFYICSLLVFIMRYYIAQPGEQRIAVPEIDSSHLVNRAVRYTERHMSENIDVREISKSLGVSKSTLYNSFISSVSLPPTRFLSKYKMKRATIMLQDQMPIKEIASMLGYSSICHFSNTFKSVVGLSPSQWKKYKPRNSIIRL